MAEYVAPTLTAASAVAGPSTGLERRGRVPLPAAIVAAIVTVLLAFAAAIVITTDLMHNDFTEEYASATLLRQGNGAAVYDPAAQAVTEAGASATGTLSPASWSPVAQVLIVPLTLLPLRAATVLWILCQVACLAAAAAVAAGAAPWASGTGRVIKLICAGAALAAFGTLVDVADAQWDGIPTLGLALAYSEMRKGRDGRAMLWIAMSGLAGKPHLALGLGVFLLARRPRTLLTGASTAILMAIITVLVVPWSALHGFVSNISSQNGDHVLVAGSVGVPGFFASLVEGRPGWVLGYAGSALLLAGCGWLGRRSRVGAQIEPVFLCVTLLSVLVPTHVFHYDFVQVLPAVVAMLAWCGQADRARGHAWPGPATHAVLGATVLVTLVGYTEVLPLGSYAPSPILPALLLGCAAACWAAAVSRSRAPVVRVAAVA